jgi:hypothetical protein
VNVVKNRTVLEKLAAFLERFLGLSSLGDEDGGISLTQGALSDVFQ